MARIRFHERLGAFGATAVLGVMGASALLPKCGPATSNKPAVRLSMPAPTTVATALTALVNDQRVAAGLAPLVESSMLDSVAASQSSDQAGRQELTHTGSNGSDAGTRMTAIGFIWRTWGENVAAGQTTPEQAMDAWMHSAGHRANILNPAFTTIGVAAMQGANGVTYWTMDLAAPA